VSDCCLRWFFFFFLRVCAVCPFFLSLSIS
jgi:hypothetical protein